VFLLVLKVQKVRRARGGEGGNRNCDHEKNSHAEMTVFFGQGTRTFSFAMLLIG
jgi:hypothetical protein